MKIRICSDLHIEFGKMTLPQADADCTFLAGDIGVGLQGVEFARHIPHPVFYVAGNHEFYHGEDFQTLIPQLKAAAEGTNVRVLENDAVVFNGVRILGCTLWTDFQFFGAAKLPLALIEASARLNDYRGQIFNNNRKLKPADTAERHTQSRKWLADQLAKPFNGPTVVLTHHAPSESSLMPIRIPNLVDASFASRMDDFIKSHKINLWVHGHTHLNVDYVLGKTRILSNPAGYRHEPAEKFDPCKVVAVD